MLYLWLIEFRPNDLALPRNPRWTDDLLQISNTDRAARLCSPPENAPERRVI
jgi:hypothetical protein